MAAAADVDCLVNLDDFDIDDDFDVVIQALDLDLSADDKFRGGACCSAIFSDADTVSHCRHACDGDGDGSAATAVVGWLLAGLGDDDDCGDGAEEEEEEEAGSSPAYSGVTDDGSLAPAAGDDADDAEAISAYVAELERFLLQDNDDDEQAEVDQGLLGVVDDYFAGDQLLATAEVVPARRLGGLTERRRRRMATAAATFLPPERTNNIRPRGSAQGTSENFQYHQVTSNLHGSFACTCTAVLALPSHIT